MSLRITARLGSNASISGIVRLFSGVSVLDAPNVCALTDMTRVRDRMYALCVFHLGSSFSLRGFSCLGSEFSISSVVDVGRSLSVLDFGTMGSSLSIRSVTIAGGGFPAFNVAKLGCSMSLVDSRFLSSRLRSVPANVRQTGE